MVKAYSVPVSELLVKVSHELKNMQELRAPEWAEFAKTGAHRERPPLNSDWWYLRAASILRKVQLLGPVGVSKLRTKYGGKKNRGMKPEEFRKGSGSIIRRILQQLEAAELIKQAKIKNHKGRVITPKGLALISKYNIADAKPVKVQPKAAPKAEPKAAVKPAADAKSEHKVEQKPAPAVEPKPEVVEEEVKVVEETVEETPEIEEVKEDGRAGEDKTSKD